MKKIAKKIKEIVKGSPKESFGTNPSDPWSAKYGIAESSLDQYLLARGINPKFISKETKISHAKSLQFQKWKRDHVRESISVQHSPTELRQHALKKAQQMNKVIKHSDVAEVNEVQMDKLSPAKQAHVKRGRTFTVNLGNKTADEKPKSLSKPKPRSQGFLKSIFAGEEIMREAKTTQGTALDKFRQAAAERAKKHAEIEKQSKEKPDMKGAIDRLEKHLNKEDKKISKDDITRFHAKLDKLVHTTFGKRKSEMNVKEEVEQIDELKKSTVFSWLKQQPVVPEKKPGMSRKDHNQKIKTHNKSWNRALDRLSGYKPTSEDIWQDGQAPTQTSFDGANAPDNTEPSTSHIKAKSARSKSARMIKSLYKHHNVKEELYDHEKEDKSVATYGKKPKMQKVDQEQNYGDKSPKAAAVLSGGKTLTGKTRDTLEIDPEMRKPTRPDGKKEEQK
jgi:hypothetical protein